MKFNDVVNGLLNEVKKSEEDGNEFSGALAKARKEGKPTMKVGGKTISVKPGKKKAK